MTVFLSLNDARTSQKLRILDKIITTFEGNFGPLWGSKKSVSGLFQRSFGIVYEVTFAPSNFPFCIIPECNSSQEGVFVCVFFPWFLGLLFYWRDLRIGVFLGCVFEDFQNIVAFS